MKDQKKKEKEKGSPFAALHVPDFVVWKVWTRVENPHITTSKKKQIFCVETKVKYLKHQVKFYDAWFEYKRL